VLTILAFLVLLVVMAVIFEERLIYFPEARLEVTPEALGMGHDELALTTSDDERLHGWFLPSPVDSDHRYTVLMCHGNAGNISHRLDRTLLMHSNLGTDVLLFDYRGFGRSSGAPSEPGTYDDARAAYRYLVDERGIPGERIVLFGESLGAAVALQLATEVDAAGLVLEAPFTSIRDMAKEVYPFIPNGWVRTRYENLEKIAALAMPLLVIHGTEDATVPFDQGQKLFDAAPEPKQFVAIDGAGHSDNFLVGRDRYWPAWKEFLARLSDEKVLEER
jgi:alpha-beta hydrolase superfamily lysophospholipase